MRHVPYSGASQYVLDMVAGRVDMASSTLGTFLQNREQLRGLGLALPKRSNQSPEIPTMGETLPARVRVSRLDFNFPKPAVGESLASSR